MNFPDSMSARDKLIIRLIRLIAVLLGKGKEFDEHAERTSKMTTEELRAETKRTMEQINKELGGESGQTTPQG